MAEASLQLPGSALSVEPTTASPLMLGALVLLGAADVAGAPIGAVAADVAVFWPPAFAAVTLTLIVSPRSSLVGV